MALFFMAETNLITTQNPLIASATGQEITEADQAKISDFNRLPLQSYVDKYGEEDAAQMLQDRDTLINNLYTPRAAESRSAEDVVADTVKNVISGAITGVIDTGALASNLAGAESLSRILSEASQNVQEYSQSLGSYGEQAQQQQYNLKQQGLNARLDREYQEAIARGDSETEAQLSRFGKEAWGTLGNLFSTGQASQVVSSGLGSLGSAGAVSGGFRLAGKGLASVAKKMAPTASEKALKAFNGSSNTVQKVIKATPWMASVGLQEGGSQFTQVLNEALNTPIEDLYAKSPAFVEAVKAHMDEGMDKTSAENAAREDMAFAAGRQAGLETAAIAGAINYFTRGLEKPFSRMGKSYGKYVGESFIEPGEESITESAGQYVSNKAIQEYIDETQNPIEGLGQSFTEGAVGGLGIVGTRAVPAVAAQAIADTIRQHYSPENYFKSENINNALQSLEDEKSSIEQALPQESYQDFYRVKDSLKDLVNTVEETKTDPETKKVSNVMTDEKAVEVLNEVDQGIKTLNNVNSSKEDPFLKRHKINRTKANVERVLGGVQYKARQSLEANAQKRRATYIENTELTPEQIQAEGTYLAGLKLSESALNPVRTTQAFKALSKNQQEALRKASFSNPMVQHQMDIFFGRAKPDEVTTDTPTASTVTIQSFNPDEDFTVSSAEIRVKSNRAYKPISQEELSKYGEVVNTIPVPETEDTAFILRNNNGQPQATLRIGQEEFYFTPEQAKQIENATSDPEIVEILQNARKLIKQDIEAENKQQANLKNIQAFTLDQNGIQTPVIISNNTYKVGQDGEVRDLPKSIAKVLQDSSSTPEQKTEAVRSLVRYSEQINPTELAKQNKYFEDGEIKDYDSEKVKANFKNTFKDGLDKILTPVKRAIHLWTSDNPNQLFRDTFGSKEKITEYLRSNHFTNAEVLINSLFDQTDSVDIKEVIDRDDSLINQVLFAINPEGTFQRAFNKHLNLDSVSFLSDPKAKERIKQIAGIAAVQWTATLSAYAHSLNENELRKFFPDIDVSDASLELDGVIEEMALQNLATTLRKFMGVNQNNEAIGQDVDKFFGALAVETAKALIKAGIINRTPTLLTTPGITKEVVEYIPSRDYQNLFRPKASIITSLLDPTFKNTWSTDLFKTKTTIAHTAEKINDSQLETVERLNKAQGSINTYLINAVDMLGGGEGINEILYGEEANNQNRYRHSWRNWISKKGQALSRRLGYDFINEIRIGNKGKDLGSIPIYFSNVVLKNGRFMQEGAATYQSNKVVRQFINYLNAKVHDLMNQDNLKAWKLTLAQKLGEKVNKKPFEDYEQFITDALEFVKNNSKLSNEFIQGLSNNTTTDLRESFTSEQIQRNKEELKALIQVFNENFKDSSGYKITDEEGFNALIEMLRYNSADEKARKNFDSRIFLEIDGINDGPSNITSLFTLAMSSFTPQFLQNSAKTGNYIGADATSQQALKAGTEETKALGVNGEDYHEEVAAKRITKNVLQRIIELNKLSKDKNNQLAQSGKLGIQGIEAMLKLLKYTGFIEGNINLISSLDKLPSEDNYPFRFTRDVSKKLVTIIPYGSEAKGSTQQVVSLMVDALYENISKALEKVDQGQSTQLDDSMFNQNMKALVDLLNTDFENNLFTPTGKSTEGFTNSLQTKLPSRNELLDAHWTAKSANGRFVYVQDGKVVKDKSDIRNFYITQEGLDHLTKIMLPLFGEPAQSAVNEALGPSGMKGGRYPTAIAGILNNIAQGVEQYLRYQAKGNFNTLTGKEKYKQESKIRNFSPVFETSRNGSKVFVRKEDFTTNRKAIYTDKETGIAYYASEPYITSAGVSGGPLVVQSAGDASMIRELTSLAQNLFNFGQVYDGVYLSLDKINEAGKAANSASARAQRQKVIKSISNQLDRVGKRLIKEGWSKKTEPREALIDCLSNLAEGKFINGDSIKEDSYKLPGIQYELLRYLEKINSDSTFDPKLNTNKKSTLNLFKSSDNIRNNLETQLNQFFNTLDAVILNEEINHRVVDALPKTIHHMSAGEANYKEGTPLTAKAINKLLKDVNALYPENKFANFQELEAAYMNHLVQILFNTQYSKDPRFKKAIPAWLQLTNRTKGNEGLRSDLSPEAIHLIESAFGKKLTERFSKVKKNVSVKIEPSQDKEVLKKAFNQLGRNSKDKAILNNLYKKVSALLPKDIQVSIFNSLDNLPQEIRQYFENSNQIGLYITFEGTPRIFIRDLAGNRNLLDPKNLTTLVHESIHAAISGTIDQYYQDSSKLSSNQREAIQNLENLLNDFMDSTLWDKEQAPKCIDELRNILESKKDKAERLDESLAYIFSNQEILQNFANYKLKDSSKHIRNFASLLTKIVQAAKNAWRKLLNIVTGTPMDTLMNENTSLQLLEAKPLDFLGLYGANTLVVLNENQQRKNKGKPYNSNLKQGKTRSSLNLDPSFSYWYGSNLRNSLKSKLSADATFEVLAERGSGYRGTIHASAAEITKRVNERVDQELDRIQRYKDTLYRLTKDFITNPQDFVDLTASLMDKESMTDSNRLALQQAYLAITKNLNETFMLDDPTLSTQEEIDRSKALYDLIKGTYAPLIRENLEQPESFHPKWKEAAILFALAQTNLDIAERLGKIHINADKPELKNWNLNQYLEDFGNYLADKWAADALNNKDIASATQVLNPGKGTLLINSAERIEGALNSFIDGIAPMALSLVLLPFKFTKKPIAKEIKNIISTYKVAPLDSYRMVMEFARSLTNRISNPMVANLLSDLYGRVPSNTEVQTYLKMIKGFEDKQRKNVLEDLPKLFEKAFKNTKITPQLRKTLSRTIGKTDLSLLTLDEAKQIFSQPNALLNLTKEAEGSLAELAPQYSKEYLNKIQQLANFLTGSRESGHNLLTNAVAIARLLGIQNMLYISENDPIVQTIDRLVTFYAIRNLKSADVSLMAELYKKDPEAIENILQHLKEVRKLEDDRVRKYFISDPRGYEIALNNKIKGWLPRGTEIHQDYRIVSASELQDYKNRGYTILGQYPASNIDSSEPMYRVIFSYSQTNPYQEGIFQSINRTDHGYQINKMTRGEALGTKIRARQAIQNIFKKYIYENTPNGVIPLYDSNGDYIGFERAIPPEDRQYIEGKEDIFSGIAQYYSRIDREQLADEINKVGVDLAWKEYENATPEAKKREFIDVFHTDNPVIKDAVSRMDGNLKRAILAKFTDGNFYLKKDEVYTYLGYVKTSMTDMWDGKFILPRSVEKLISQVLDLIFANGKGKYYLHTFEQVASSAISFAKDTIIVRSGIVPAINAITNVMSLIMVLGMSPSQVWKYYKENWAMTQKYKKLTDELHELEFQKTNAKSESIKNTLDKKIKDKVSEIENLPIYKLIKEGEYSTISDTGVSYERVDLFKQNMDTNLNALIDKFGGKGSKLKKGATELLMLKGSGTFKFMAEAVNMGDWLAKTTAYRYLTEQPKGKSRLSHDMARNIASILFIDYDQFVGRERDWLNRLGIFWFMTFKYRIFTAAILGMFLNPTRMILGSVLNGFIDFGGTPLTENVFSKTVTGAIPNSFGWDMAVRGIFMHPLAVATGLN